MAPDPASPEGGGVIDLRAERLNRGKSVEAMAQEIGVEPHVLRYAEKGGTPRPENALLIATFFGQKVTDLWPVEAAA